MSLNLKVGRLLKTEWELRKAISVKVDRKTLKGYFSVDADASQSLDLIESLEERGIVHRLTPYRSSIEIFKVPKRSVKRFARELKKQVDKHLETVERQFLRNHFLLAELYVTVRDADTELYIFT